MLYYFWKPLSHEEHHVMSKYISVSVEKQSFFSCSLLSQFLCIYLREKVQEILATIHFGNF
jgi:hypothetical protein